MSFFMHLRNERLAWKKRCPPLTLTIVSPIEMEIKDGLVLITDTWVQRRLWFVFDGTLRERIFQSERERGPQ